MPSRLVLKNTIHRWRWYRVDFIQKNDLGPADIRKAKEIGILDGSKDDPLSELWKYLTNQSKFYLRNPTAGNVYNELELQ